MPQILSRQRTAELLETNSDDFWSHRIDVALVILISLNVAAVILGSITSLQQSWRIWFFGFEVVSVAVFTIEYVLRVWSSLESSHYDRQRPIVSRIRYILSPYALIDLIAILPFYLGFFFWTNDWRFLRVVRLLRLLKLTRYSLAMQALLGALKAEADSLVAAIILLSILFILASSGIYLIENKIQPDAFGSIPAAMWWAMATLTTVGYGDVVPVTPLGKIFGGCITIIGVGMVALPAGIIASGFSENLRQRRASYDDLFSTLLEEQTSWQARKLTASALGNTLNLKQENIERLLQAVADKQQKPTSD